MPLPSHVVNVPGNLYDKYNTENPLARLIMRHFLRSFDDLVGSTSAINVYEAGCGEGHLSCRLLDRGLIVRGSDLEPNVVAQANRRAVALGYGVRFAVRSIYDLQPAEASANLVICCEVLEHLPDPAAALRVLTALANPYLLVSVPREPLWRVLNVIRGAYLNSFGNTPGHVQHWTSREFLNLLRRYVDIVKVQYPIPWTMVLCKAPETF